MISFRKFDLYINVFLLFFTAFVSTSPLWYNLGGNAFITYLIIFSLFIMAHGFKPFNKKLLLLAFLVFFGSFIPAIFWFDFRYIVYSFYFIFSLFLVSKLSFRDFLSFINISTSFFIIILIGCWIGFLFYLGGGNPLGSITNPDGRANYFFITTFSNILYEGFIRPSGIYDEPGTLAFFVSFVIFTRCILHLKIGPTVILLILGFITFSYAYFIFSALIFFTFFNKRNFVYLLVTTSIVFIFIFKSSLFQLFDTYLFTRVAGGLQEDGRYILFQNALRILKSEPSTIFLGLHPDCIFNIEKCNSISGYFSENPLAPIVAMGLFLSWPYYFFIAFIIIKLFRFQVHSYLLFAFGIQFLQRPNVMSHGYSLLAVSAIWLFINRQNFYEITTRYYHNTRFERGEIS